MRVRVRVGFVTEGVARVSVRHHWVGRACAHPPPDIQTLSPRASESVCVRAYMHVCMCKCVRYVFMSVPCPPKDPVRPSPLRISISQISKGEILEIPVLIPHLVCAHAHRYPPPSRPTERARGLARRPVPRPLPPPTRYACSVRCLLTVRVQLG